MHDGDLERRLLEDKNDFFICSSFYFTYSGIPDLALRILKMLISLCFSDALQPARSKTRKLRKRRKPRKFFPTFSLPTFRFWPNTQNRKLGRRKFGKKIPRFLTFPSFLFTTFCKTVEFFFDFWLGYDYRSFKHIFRVIDKEERVNTVETWSKLVVV